MATSRIKQSNLFQGKSKGKAHSRTGHEGSEAEYVCVALLFMWAGWLLVVNAKPRPLYPLQVSGTHCIGGWVWNISPHTDILSN